MHPVFFNPNAQKKPTNVSINSDLLQQAKEHHVNLSQTLELRLAEILREKKQREWQAENQEAIKEYNKRIEAHGVFSDGLRQF
jgi:antitoxin CcdA